MGSGKSTLNTILLYTVEINNNYNVLHWTLHVYTWLNDNLRSSWGPMKLNPKEKLHWITFFSKMKCNAEEKVHWIYNILLNKMECGGKTALDLKIYFRGRLLRTSGKILDFQTTPPPLVRVCPDFTNPPPPVAQIRVSHWGGYFSFFADFAQFLRMGGMYVNANNLIYRLIIIIIYILIQNN